jgi:hypothetical protein
VTDQLAEVGAAAGAHDDRPATNAMRSPVSRAARIIAAMRPRPPRRGAPTKLVRHEREAERSRA